MIKELSHSPILRPVNCSGNDCVLKAISSWYPCTVLPRDVFHQEDAGGRSSAGANTTFFGLYSFGGYELNKTLCFVNT